MLEDSGGYSLEDLSESFDDENDGELFLQDVQAFGQLLLVADGSLEEQESEKRATCFATILANDKHVDTIYLLKDFSDFVRSFPTVLCVGSKVDPNISNVGDEVYPSQITEHEVGTVHQIDV